jgi:DNA-binding NarL/FixJ family response regulator
MEPGRVEERASRSGEGTFGSGGSDVVQPTCSTHPGSLVRRYRSAGPGGRGVYPQCVPRDGDRAHLLAWGEETSPPDAPDTPLRLSPSLSGVLEDAANGLTVAESAASRWKSRETVKTQRALVLQRLSARNISEAVAIAIGIGLIRHRHAA